MIELINLTKKFGDKVITAGITLTIPSGQMTCIVGRSGEGKSVLLKQIMGLITPTSGDIIIDGVNITRLEDYHLSSLFSKCGYVFQFAALLDSLTVYENVGISLIERQVPEESVMQAVKEKLSLVNLGEEVVDKYPSEISGGMRKRVGIARTLIKNPSIILYDEPTTGLDPINTKTVHELMHRMQQTLRTTSLVISHDVEIFKYVDNVALLHEGTIKFFGPAKTIWQSENPYIYQFIRGLSTGPIKST